ncbi:hypothetical protein PSPO01_03369 [Paraphaeosphaeria sporulosa]
MEAGPGSAEDEIFPKMACCLAQGPAAPQAEVAAEHLRARNQEARQTPSPAPNGQNRTKLYRPRRGTVLALRRSPTVVERCHSAHITLQWLYAPTQAKHCTSALIGARFLAEPWHERRQPPAAPRPTPFAAPPPTAAMLQACLLLHAPVA